MDFSCTVVGGCVIELPRPTNVGGDEEFVGAKLGGPIEVARTTGLIGGKRNHPLYALIDASIDQIHSATDISLHTLEGVVFCDWHNFGSCGMHHVIDAIQCPVQTILVADITDKKPHAVIVAIELGHLPLFHLISGENNQLLRVVLS